MFKKQTLTFLKWIKKNNDRTWFQNHKDDYQKARNNFIEVFDDFAGNIVTMDNNFRDSIKESHIFRLNRDVRFSHNKNPYKTHFWAYICPGWKTNMDHRACYYLHIEPGNSFIGGGVMPEKEYLAKIRERITESWNELEDILWEAQFKKYFKKLSESSMLKTAPRWYPKDHKYIDFLRHKNITAISYLTDEQVLSEDILDILQRRAKAFKPLNDWLNNIYV